VLKPERNQPCPCGSGKKYKRCCGCVPPLARATAGPRAMAQPTAIETGQLVGLLNGGQYAEAESAARALIDRFPALGLAWKVLGIAQLVLGKNAVDSLQGAAALLPNDADVFANLGNALHNAGRLDEAIASCRRALVIDPKSVEALNNLGNALMNSGRPAEAVECYARAIRLRPSFAPAFCNLGNAQRSLGQLPESLQSCRHALRLDPRLIDAHGNLGNTLRDLGQFEEAVASYREALRLAPRHAGVLNNLGSVLRDLGRLDEAANRHWQALQANPNYADAYVKLGQVLTDLGRPLDAESVCRKALELGPDLATAHAFAGDLAVDQGDLARAEASYRRALALNQDLPEAWLGLRRLQRDDPQSWEATARRLLEQRQPLRIAIDLHYALGEHYDAAGRYDLAFAHFREANEHTKVYGLRYDREATSRQTDRILREYDEAFFAAAADGANDSNLPVFIVGMPRSGTSLAEQILAAHPEVFGAGECPFWVGAEAALSAAAQRPSLTPELRGKIAADYLQLLGERAGAARRVVDKMPSTTLPLGLIHAILPNARFIHMQRDPIDTCLSIYAHNLAKRHPYAADLQDLVHQYREYLRLMAHWRRVLPDGSLLEVSYEGLVAGQETWSRRMIEFLGLPWDPACLASHTNTRTVMTHSKWQVRQPITAASIGRWRHYAAHVETLLALQAGGSCASG
jgi:tetratricopeptide (TPR) repeat protein